MSNFLAGAIISEGLSRASSDKMSPYSACVALNSPVEISVYANPYKFVFSSLNIAHI